MRPRRSVSLLLPALALAVPAVAAAQQQTVNLVAGRDAGIMAESGTLANGAGTSVHVGVTNDGNERRALVRFSLASIPAGSTIVSVRLRMWMSRSRGGALPVELRRITSTWSEGPADPTQGEGQGAPASAGDVTWSHAVYDSDPWGTAGGDLAAAASASETIGTATGSYSWTSAQMAADAQSWLDAPAGNHGWMLVAPAAVVGQARRFESRESTSGATRRPTLIVTFTAPVPTGACCAADGGCSVVSSPGTDCAGSYQGNGTDCAPNPCPQPEGACCLPDSTGTCEIATEAACLADGGAYGGDDSGCGAAMCPVVLTPFVDPLPIPPVAQPVSGSPGGAADYEIAAVEIEQTLHSQLPPSRVWGYDDGTGGVYPGPTILARRDQPVSVTWKNDIRGPDGAPRTSHYLPVDSCIHGAEDAARTVVHLHGGHVAAESDGYPEDAYGPGEELVYEYPNWQPAATLWYHDHALGITRLNVYLGLAGLYLVQDDQEAALELPRGAHDLPLVIQDRTFNPDGTLQYPAMWMEHFFGDTNLVNGRVWPYLEVDRGKYRFRILNGSNSRFYRLALSDGASFQVIASDTGLLAAPVTVSSILVGPGERVEVVIDFAGYPAGTRLRLVNSAPAPFPGAPGEGVVPQVMQFRVGAAAGHTAPVPASLAALTPLDPADAAVERDFELARADDDCGGARWLINGKEWHEVSEKPRLGTVEIWRFINRSGVTHPMHMHLVSFRVLDRQEFAVLDGEIQPIGQPVPPEPVEDGWKDTVQVPPNQMVRVIARFEDFVGRFPYHCHMLEHEDHEMMRQFETVTECGDGVLGMPVEDCDEGGGQSATCDQDCTTPTCGDGLVNQAAGEECDDGRQEDGDGCSAACLDEPGGGAADGDGCGCRAGGGVGAGGWLLLLFLATRRRRAASRSARPGGPAGS